MWILSQVIDSDGVATTMIDTSNGIEYSLGGPMRKEIGQRGKGYRRRVRLRIKETRSTQTIRDQGNPP